MQVAIQLVQVQDALEQGERGEGAHLELATNVAHVPLASLYFGIVKAEVASSGGLNNAMVCTFSPSSSLLAGRIAY